jgi:hypothetical protein
VPVCAPPVCVSSSNSNVLFAGMLNSVSSVETTLSPYGQNAAGSEACPPGAVFWMHQRDFVSVMPAHAVAAV